MRAAFFVPVFAAAVFAQESSSDDFPQTRYLTETNSLGVVTGMPSVATSQPAVAPAETSIPPLATSVGNAASIPAIGTSGLVTLVQQGTMGVNSTQTIIVSANNSTTVIVSTIGVGQSTSSNASPTGTSGSPSQSGDSDENASGTATGSGTGPASTGAAATMRAVAGSVVGVGAFVAAFL